LPHDPAPTLSGWRQPACFLKHAAGQIRADHGPDVRPERECRETGPGRHVEGAVTGRRPQMRDQQLKIGVAAVAGAARVRTGPLPELSLNRSFAVVHEVTSRALSSRAP